MCFTVHRMCKQSMECSYFPWKVSLVRIVRSRAHSIGLNRKIDDSTISQTMSQWQQVQWRWWLAAKMMTWCSQQHPVIVGCMMKTRQSAKQWQRWWRQTKCRGQTARPILTIQQGICRGQQEGHNDLREGWVSWVLGEIGLIKANKVTILTYC